MDLKIKNTIAIKIYIEKKMTQIAMNDKFIIPIKGSVQYDIIKKKNLD